MGGVAGEKSLRHFSQGIGRPLTGLDRGTSHGPPTN